MRWPDRHAVARMIGSAILGAALAPLPSQLIAVDAQRPAFAPCLSSRKGPLADDDADVPIAEPVPTRATLFNIHTGEATPLSDDEPRLEVFSAMLSDRVTGETKPVAPALLALLRALCVGDDPRRVEFVSGYRSWKLNEMLRKKGHKVASHSQHSLGFAMDFRLDGMSSKELAAAVEKLKWKGGLAHYPGDSDRFVHADVGPNRRWRGR